MDNENVGLLILPSLEDEDRYIEVSEVSFAEAKELIEQFTAKVVRERPKLKSASNEEPLLVYQNFFNIEEFDTPPPGEIIDRLDRAEIPGSRGRRAVYASMDGDCVAVGTTVVYNKNWATLGVVDPNVAPILKALSEEYEGLTL